MARLLRVEMTRLKCALLLLLLCLSVCLSQRDCTGVDCPVLNNCIQEVLESGACCASCVTTGCTCEGYQYYDCVNAGFKNGKVAEGESYFVDYGSTECSCPEGGGRISCHFISCPEIPANCIEVSEPADGCMQCERIGCVHDSQKYEAGHSFHMDPCKVCHCPNDGGMLMCYPVPNCDPSKVHKPMLASQTEENTASSRHRGDPYEVDRQGSTDHFSKPYRLSPPGNVPLFKTSPLEEAELEEMMEEYDYGPTDLPELYPDTLAFPTQSTAITNRVISVSRVDSGGADRTSTHQSFDRRPKQELRERYGVHEHTTDRVEATDGPTTTAHQSTAGPSSHREDTTAATGTTAWQRSTQSLAYTRRGSDSQIHPGHPLGNSESQLHPQKVSDGQMHPQRNSDRVVFPLHRGSEDQSSHPLHPQRSSENTVHPHRTTESKTRAPAALDRVVLPLHPLRGPESQKYPQHPARGAENHTHSQRGSDSMILPWFPLRNRESPVHPQPDSKSRILPVQYSQVPVTPYIHYTDEEEVDEEREEEEEEEERVVTLKDVTGPRGRDVSYDIGLVKPDRNTSGGHAKPDGSDPARYHEKTTVEPSTTSHRRPAEHQTLPTVHFSPTSPPPLRVKAGGSQPSEKQPQTLFNLHTEDTEELEQEERNTSPVFLHKPERGPVVPGPGVPGKDPVESCCEVGQRWASENHHCHHMPPLDHDQLSVCSVAQKQCCSGSLKENQCKLAMAAARGGNMCEMNVGDECADDSYQVCCSCCALGLRVSAEGRGCYAHQYLGYPCGHVFLACCEGEDSQQPLRRKEKPRPTTMPWKVLDRKFPKEAFSIDATDEAANSLEEPEDVDECLLHRGQLCQHTCANTWGSYQCGCHAGYVLQPDRHSCTPVSPEEDNRLREDNSPARDAAPPIPTDTTTTSTPAYLNPCAGNGPCSQQCAVVSGQVRCSCFPGFSLMADGHMCEDVNECRTGTHSCPHGDLCVNKQGSFHCVDPSETCEEGFIYDMNSECVDVNECVSNTHSCQPSERCVNTVGSFVCERLVTCSAGYQLRNAVCEDIDECMVRTHNCGVGFECKNTEGSFLCNPKQKCLTGFTQDSHGNCIDINECSSLSESCSSGFNCINTVGSYTCQKKVVACGQGYHSSADGAKCVDMDECQLGTHRCGTGQICHNLPGSYRCDCQTGYQYDALRKVCTDVNECWRYPGRLCAQTCENTPGSYHCSCTAGFSLAFDGKNCEDLNECDKNPCSQECANIYGSYQCYCRQGFYLKEDGHTCEDIDECAQSVGNLCAFQCVNVPGSYQCACPPHGYTMSANGRTCRDIDECTTGSHNCSLGQTCYNIQGGHRCLSFDCPQNYKKMSDTRCERTSCSSNSPECQSSPLRITYYQLSFQTNIVIPAQIFRIGPSPAYSGDHIVISITRGNEDGYFSTRKLNSFTGAVYLQRQMREPRDFLIDVEMKLLRQGTFTSFLARIYVFITASSI